MSSINDSKELFGLKLKAQRLSMYLNLHEASEVLKIVSPMQLSDIEEGRIGYTLNTAKKLSKLYNIPLEDFKFILENRGYYSALTLQQRQKIEENKNYSTSTISKLLNINVSTIKREFQRCNGKDNYNAIEAQESIKVGAPQCVKKLEARIDVLETLIQTLVQIFKDQK